FVGNISVSLVPEVKTFARNIYNQFYVNVTFVHYYNYSLEQSKSFEEIRVDIANEIRERTEWLTNVVDWADFSLVFVLVFLFIKAHLYRIRYLTADHFDNVYISFYIKDIDDRRLEMGKETILPLTNRERRKYVSAFSLRMARSERRSLLVAATLLLISGLQMGFYMILDYSLYQLLSLIRYYGRLEAKGQLPAVVQIQVKGDGVMADLYRQMVTRFDPLMSSVPEFDTAQCLPVPLPVDLDRYQRIVLLRGVGCTLMIRNHIAMQDRKFFLDALLYTESQILKDARYNVGICLLLAVTQSYGLRLRHVICGCYYPQREKARAVWLYNHILKTRGSLQKFLSNQIRRRVYGDDTVDKISFLERLSHQSKLIARILKAAGYVKIYCVCCNEAGKPEDYENFKRCSTPGCNGIYCLPCFEDIRNVCELCAKPVEYEDPDFSEEKDSSEEEEREKSYDHSVQKEESDEEDYEYQYDEAKSLDDISVSSSSDSEPRKRKRRLASMDDLEDDDEEEKV
ncbi:LOW QUALITY PROTEIN: DC-STAMP domain-containing protein 2-like, partial [Stegodyphus dumicola]|uniref:LOW QUALITY PROTEIN: DC-STAMP domain-containing protein 2-like n=1 Tax=Stegodyphus dumicola TaxID=202533 RepID=UPI0015B2D859